MVNLMIELQELFDIKYGHGLELNKLEECKNGINFISRTSKNNGVSSRVSKYNKVEPYPEGMITVSLGGSVLESFIQPQEFYTGYHTFCLTPKITLSVAQKAFYCMCIKANKYKYNYGRQANKTLKTILVPSIDEIPKWIEEYDISKFDNINEPILNIATPSINTKKWFEFRYDEVFEIKKGYYNKKPDESIEGNIPFIGATDGNNGVTSWYDIANIKGQNKTGEKDNNIAGKIFDSGSITVSNDGSVGHAFFQPIPFTCSHSVNPLYLKGGKPINSFIAMFLCTVIEQERFRWNYGRKWRPKRMPSSTIKLPVDKNGELDWKFMETYIRSLPYSSHINNYGSICI